ncbi:MAG TPA: RHS repeat domain-containing protein [Puia sp.]|nr:RHS repeat domain-containing protein [Puia sp.]
MKELIGLLSALLIIGSSAEGQFYYKDILVTKQSMENWRNYKENSVRSVKLTSYESNGKPTEGFSAEQSVAKDFSQIVTSTRSSESAPTNLTSFYDANGQLIKTVDTSDSYQSTTEFGYDSQGKVQIITNSSLETDNQVKETEQHIWKYAGTDKPVSMLKIKNGTDSTFIQFLTDEKGNIAEERPTHNKQALPVIYYYYNNENRLTDIVKFNAKAHRLLPDYIFEYDNAGHLSSMLYVQEGSNDYQKWNYLYNEKGLKRNDTCFNKKKELLGKIEYEYSYAK